MIIAVKKLHEALTRLKIILIVATIEHICYLLLYYATQSQDEEHLYILQVADHLIQTILTPKNIG